MKTSSRLLKAVVFAALLNTVSAYSDNGQANPLVAKVNGMDIRKSDFDEFKQIFPPELVKAAEEKDAGKFHVTLVRQLVDLKLVIQEAKKLGLEKTPEVQEALKKITEQLIFKAYISDKLKNALTDEAVRKLYDEERKNMPKDAKETRARHIMVKDEKTAKDIIKKLDEGADFQKLAREMSLDKASGQEGGDLGYFGKEDFIPEISQEAFGLAPGKYSKAPVKSPSGWHIIKVDDRRTAKPKSINEVENRLKAQIMEKETAAVMKNLRDKASIEIYDEKGQVIKDALKDDVKETLKK